MFDWKRFADGKIAVFCNDIDQLDAFLSLMHGQGIFHDSEQFLQRAVLRVRIAVRGPHHYATDVEYGFYKNSMNFRDVNEVHAEDIFSIELSRFDEQAFLELIK